MEAGIQVVVRGNNGVWHDRTVDWTALVCLASLSADPYSLAEFAAAMRRYLPSFRLEQGARAEHFAWKLVNDDQPWCVIDLVGRTIVANSTFELPGKRAAYQNEEARELGGFNIVWIDLADDWIIETVPDARTATPLESRYQQACAVSPPDGRAILWGAGCWHYFAEAIMQVPLAEIKQRDVYEAGEVWEQTRTRVIHRDWMMTPREDLSGRTPRELLLRDRERLQSDLEHRSLQWSRQGCAPPPLSTDSHAYRFGLFGTTEIVMYFYWIRTVVNEGWKWRRTNPQATTSELAELLSHKADVWLDTIDMEDRTLTPREQIDLERQRLPRIVQPHDLFDDCPLCRAQAEGSFGPTFMWIDGHQLELEEDFAFSLLSSWDDWSSLQIGLADVAEVESNSENDHTSMAPLEDKPAGGPAELALDGEEISVWQRCSLQGWDSMVGPDGSPELRGLALGFPLSELAEDLDREVDGGTLRSALSDRYVDFTRVTDLSSLGAAAQALRDCLELIAENYPRLVSKSADLQARIDEVMRQTV